MVIDFFFVLVIFAFVALCPADAAHELLSRTV